MNKRLLLALLAAIAAAANAPAQLAITETMPSASTNLGATKVVQGPDFWELTNFGTNAMDLTGYIFNDSDAIRGGDANSSALSGITIGPGESIILVQSGTGIVETHDDFTNWWGAVNLPTNLQVLFYTGNGQSSSGDSIVLWAPTATSDADYVDRADFGEAVRGHSFTYNSSNGVFGVVSSNGIGGAFKAVTSDDEGSPGFTAGLVPLMIMQQPTPTNQTVPASENATFTVAARGLPHPRYQWRFKGTNLDGAIQSSLTITNAQLADSGLYSVIVSNGVQTLISSNALLTVTTTPIAPTFTTLPKDADAFIGQMVQFTAVASGSPTPAYQWLSNGVALSGQNGSQLLLPNVQTNYAATYSIVVTNTTGTNSASVTLTVGPRPRLMITEAQPTGSSESGHEDWWELTSFDTRVFNLKGWRWDDSSHSVAPGNAYVFPGDIFIHPGESIVFVENLTAAQFQAWWGTNLPANLQIVTYSGGGLGLSGTADEVNLWNAVTLVGNELSERVCAINFGATVVGATLVYDPENPPVAGVFGVPSTGTVDGAAANGIFTAEVAGSLGSPGLVTAPIQLTGNLTGDGNIALNWDTVANRDFTLEFATHLTAANWTTLTNFTATGASATVSDSTAAAQKFYRAGALIPFVPEQP